jgi:hypothetical protein
MSYEINQPEVPATGQHRSDPVVMKPVMIVQIVATAFSFGDFLVQSIINLTSTKARVRALH